MDSVFKFPISPGKPLFPLSPERVNATRHAAYNSNGGTSMPQSPSLPDLGLSNKHRPSNSDVQAVIARFNSLDIKDHAELRKRDEAALRRAQMGREEAENEVKKSREENRALRKDIEEGKDRERKVAKRLEVVMEDLHRSKETSHHAQSLYEKEIRKARKEAFRSSSALVKLQEELKATRNAFKVVQADLEMERHKAGRREEEAFTAQYELVGVQEQLAQARAQIKVVEEERDALKTNLKEEEVARIAAAGSIALPICRDDEEEFASPKKKHAVGTPATEKQHRLRVEIELLREELHLEVRQRALADERVDFLKLECQFQCCSCRVADQTGLKFVHDGSLANEMQRLGPVVARGDYGHDSMQVDEVTTPAKSDDSEHAGKLTIATPPHYEPEQDSVAFSPSSGTFRSAERRTEVKHQTPPQCSTDTTMTATSSHEMTPPASPTDITTSVMTTPHPGANQLSVSENTLLEPVTQSNTPYHVITTTTRIPLYNDDEEMSPVKPIYTHPSAEGNHTDHVTPSSLGSSTIDSTVAAGAFSAFISPPSTLTREEAIAQLRERRGRARSVVSGTRVPSDRTPINAPGTPKRAVSLKERGLTTTDGAGKRRIEKGSATPRREFSAPESTQRGRTR